MADSPTALGRLVRPLRAGVMRAAGEGVLGFLLLAGPASVAGGALGSGVMILGVLWLSCWPAWRLRRIPTGRWWSRLLVGTLRGIAMGVGLGTIGVVSIAVDWRLRGNSGESASNIALLAFSFALIRLIVLALAWFRRLVRRRLRWQLMASHVGVILLLLTMTTAIGSVVGTQVLLYGTHSSASEMATAIAGDLRTAYGPTPNTMQAQRIFEQIGNGDTQIRGEPPLSRLIQRQLVPTRMLLLSLDGRILAGQHEHIHVQKSTWFAIYGRPSLWRQLRAAALAGRHSQIQLNPVSVHERSQATVAVAPLLDARGHTVAVVVVQVSELGANARQILQATFAVFSISTVLLILATSLPVLALSFLFSYLVARGLARRLEAVSSVTTAIAGGDLSQRAPGGAPNEIGKLASDVNRMAEHLESTMGELHGARARAEDALRARQELVASISHELRTPLAIVQAHLEGLLSRQAPASRRPADFRLFQAVSAGGEASNDIAVPTPTLEALQNETHRLAALVEDLFALSRAETGALQVQLEPVDVAVLVDEVAALMRPLVRQEGQIALSVEAAPGLPAAHADADRLRQIIANLVRNAVRHTPEGGIIALSVSAEAQWIVIAVADTGDGIAPEHVPLVFERFYRVDQARGRDSGGAGLGLAIVREFVELMGGTVTVESVVGEGTVFRVYVPKL